MIRNKKNLVLIVIFMLLAGCSNFYSSSTNSKFQDRSDRSNNNSILASQDFCNEQLSGRKIINPKYDDLCFGKKIINSSYEEMPTRTDALQPRCNQKMHPYNWHQCFGKAGELITYGYEGEFINGKREGVGRFKEFGYVYVGQWKNDLPNGIGFWLALSYKGFSGKAIKGRWENGFLKEIYLQNFDLNYSFNNELNNGDFNFWRVEGDIGLFNSILYRYFENIECLGEDPNLWNYCKKEITFTNGDRYSGHWKDGKFHGSGIYFYKDGSTYSGGWKFGQKDGFGTSSSRVGNEHDYWDLGAKITYEQYKEKINKNIPKFDRDTFSLKNSKIFNLNVEVSVVKNDGEFLIKIENTENLVSLKINGEDIFLPDSKKLEIKKFAKAGQKTSFLLVAIDINGNSVTKTVSVSRPLAESKPLVAALNPAQVKKQPERDAVAIIIGIADYKNLPRADFANDDARVFYDYAIRALGVKPEYIRLLVDGDADQAEIYRAFKTWLPSRVRSSTDVYVYYSGHGLPTADGQGLYVLPQRADRDFMDKTAITQAEINAALQAAKPKSVTIFLDACYSGQARTGETLLASARPVTLKSETAAFPDGFTVITASRGDQISSSSPELKHGIFSYYLMRGMEGDADANRDGRITAGEMLAYLAENVSRQAGMMNRRQEPQLIGDANRVLVGR
ncbi:MORN motif [Oxalobacteraceae bacterium]